MDFGSAVISSGSIAQVMYFTDRYCTDGGREYGFQSVTPGTVEFYWSANTNCGRLADTLCFDVAGDGPISNPENHRVQAIVSQVVITGLGTNSHSETKWLYKAWIEADSGATYGYSMTMAVVDPYNSSYAQCSLNGGAAGNCTWSGLGGSDANFRPDQMYSITGWIYVQRCLMVLTSTAWTLATS
jgi:hypothetical protein